MIFFSSGGGETVMYPAPGFICHLDEFACEDFCLLKKNQIAAFFKVEMVHSLGGRTLFSKDWGVPECTSPDYGDAVTAYFENWRFCSKGFHTLPSDVTSNINNIHYSFGTVSFQLSTSRWYLDFADAWSDVGVCVGIDNDTCSSQVRPPIELSFLMYLCWRHQIAFQYKIHVRVLKDAAQWECVHLLDLRPQHVRHQQIVSMAVVPLVAVIRVVTLI
jgi:hypothetical protein